LCSCQKRPQQWRACWKVSLHEIIFRVLIWNTAILEHPFFDHSNNNNAFNSDLSVNYLGMHTYFLSWEVVSSWRELFTQSIH
jgi:hypothetical protein